LNYPDQPDGWSFFYLSPIETDAKEYADSVYFCRMIMYAEVKDFLNQKAEFYNTPAFIEADPIRIPHAFSNKEDIEISAFLTATLAWGQRVTILKKSDELMNRMDRSPCAFLLQAGEREIDAFGDFVHRTFNGDDCRYFLYALKQIYQVEGGLETVFSAGYLSNRSIREAIVYFREKFLSYPHLNRSRKHLPDPISGSAAKRLNMFLRWMVRTDSCGVDFGLWKRIRPADLMCPLDVHSGNVARQLGILSRKLNDWQAVEELTAVLRSLDPADPVKFDFALFGTGVNEKQTF
jgi:uncharacterized protein (TIGR02757 family)